MTPDPFDLRRFVDAQASVYEQARAEIAAGAKRGHWMWFVFPQLRGLGMSTTAHHFGIASRAEAVAYLQHPLLGARLCECTTLAIAVPGRSARQIFGTPDDLKLRSSMTLFAAVADDGESFRRALERFYGGAADPRTLELLGSAPPA